MIFKPCRYSRTTMILAVKKIASYEFNIPIYFNTSNKSTPSIYSYIKKISYSSFMSLMKNMIKRESSCFNTSFSYFWTSQLLLTRRTDIINNLAHSFPYYYYFPNFISQKAKNLIIRCQDLVSLFLSFG